MLQQPHRLLLHQLVDHIAQHGPHGIEPLVRLANVRQPHIIEQDLLDDKDGDRLGKLAARLHDAEAEWDNLRRQEKVDDIGRVVLDESSDYAQGREAEVLKGTGLGRRVEERVEEEGNVCWGESDAGPVSSGARSFTIQKQSAGLVVRGYALQQRERITDAVGRARVQARRRKQRIDKDDFLHQRRHDT